MLIKREDILNEIPLKIFSELRLGLKSNNHPFRFVVLSTVDHDVPKSRYVVLREIGEDCQLYIFTDSRSEKITHLMKNKNASLLFYEPVRQTQVIMECAVKLNNDSTFIQSRFDSLSEKQRKSYNSRKAPGERITNPSEAYEWNQPGVTENFAVLQCNPSKMEILQLDGIKHLRARFSRNGEDWIGHWVTP